ncbi:alpha/beta fold hydrolase [Actinomadura scrupuli]|uniref:alpha/beta fold hydrolase n=1 Tax=Actinomadura scrupuli TaxID=559629 RepID=UPI003D974957
MTFVVARGARFHLVEMGPVEGRPVVMLHGLFTGSAASWYFTAAPAIARRHPVRLIDWRGHGLSERTPTGYDSVSMVRDLAELTADLPPFAVAGHCWGAVVAVRFVLAHPGRVTRLALVDPSFAGSGRTPGGAALTTLAEAPAPGTRGLLERTSVLSDLAGEAPVTAAELGGLAGIPVLAVVGSRSPFRPAADLVAGALPQARCHIFGGGHDLHISAKARLTPLLADFLSAPDRSDDGSDDG